MTSNELEGLDLLATRSATAVFVSELHETSLSVATGHGGNTSGLLHSERCEEDWGDWVSVMNGLKVRGTYYRGHFRTARKPRSKERREQRPRRREGPRP